VDYAAFNNGKQVTLHTFAGYVCGAAAFLIACDLVNFIKEEDAALLNTFTGQFCHVIHVDELVGFLLDEDLVSFADFDLAHFFLLGNILPIISLTCMPMSSIPGMDMISTPPPWLFFLFFRGSGIEKSHTGLL
ncbi:hypothetical protein ADUPG1_001483, partial [Aduncisulcus paluster]